jgi:hypothetical protein
MCKWKVLLSVMLSSVGVVEAAPLWCTGTLNAIYIDSTGGFYVSGTWRQDYTQICNLRQTWNGVSSDICLLWYSLLTTSKTNSKSVTIYYSDVPYNCQNLPTYAASPGPGYAMQQ